MIGGEAMSAAAAAAPLVHPRVSGMERARHSPGPPSPSKEVRSDISAPTHLTERLRERHRERGAKRE